MKLPDPLTGRDPMHNRLAGCQCSSSQSGNGNEMDTNLESENAAVDAAVGSIKDRPNGSVLFPASVHLW